MIVDVHAHVIVPAVLREAAPDEGWRPSVRVDERGQVVELRGNEIRSAVQEIVHLDGILAAQDEAGIDRVLLCPFVPLLGYDAEPAEGLRRCRLQNEALAALVGPRVSALGCVPLQDPALAASELRALMADGRLRGVEVAASVRGAYLGDERFAPFWAAAEDTGAVVFIHPTTRGLGVDAFERAYMWNTVGNPLETTITAADLVMAGVLERHPELKIVLAHGGGALMAVRGRLRHAHSFQPSARARLSESPEDSIRRLYFDSVTHDDELLRALVDYVGPDHVLLGSDYPFDMAPTGPIEAVRALGLHPDDEAAILGGNAERLLA